MKFQTLEQFKNHGRGAIPRRVTQVAIALLGGFATVGALVAFVHLNV